MATKYILKDTILQGYSDSPYSDGIEISDAPPEFDAFTHICKRIDNKWVLEAKDFTEWNATQYQRDRASQYPSIQDVVVALAEKEEGDDTMWQEITAQRTKVKSDNPKP